MVAHTHNASTVRLRLDSSELEASLGSSSKTLPQKEKGREARSKSQAGVQAHHPSLRITESTPQQV